MISDILRKIDDSYSVKLTREMIEIPSVTGEEETLGLYIKEKLESYGMNTELQYVQPKRPNIYGVMKGSRPGKKLNYNTHTDTVPGGEGWLTDPFKSIIKDERIYGRGACDMKSGIACTLSMMKAIADSNHAFSGELSFSAVVDQEATDIGARTMMVSERWRALNGIVLAYSY